MLQIFFSYFTKSETFLQPFDFLSSLSSSSLSFVQYKLVCEVNTHFLMCPYIFFPTHTKYNTKKLIVYSYAFLYYFAFWSRSDSITDQVLHEQQKRYMCNSTNKKENELKLYCLFTLTRYWTNKALHKNHLHLWTSAFIIFPEKCASG